MIEPISEFLYVYCKGGDQRFSPGTSSEYFGMFHGMAIDYVDPLAREGHSYDITPDSMVLRAFAVLKVKKSLLPQILIAINPVNPINPYSAIQLTDEVTAQVRAYRPRGGYVNFEALGEFLKKPTLNQDILAYNKSVPILDCTELTAAQIFSDTAMVDFVKSQQIIDQNAFTSGTKTYGSTALGDDYDTYVQAAADLGSPLTGNVNIRCNHSHTETGSSIIAPATGAYTLTNDAVTKHNGDPTSTLITTINSNVNGWMLFQGSGTWVVKDLYLKAGANAGTYQSLIGSSGATGAIDATIRDLLIDFDGKTMGGVYSNHASFALKVFNFTGWDHVQTSYFYAFSMSVNGNASIMKCENCSFYNCSMPVENSNKAMTYRNLSIFGATTNVDHITNSVGTNCGTDKSSMGFATNTDCQVSLVAGTEFVSTDSASADFLKLANGSVQDTTGIAPAIAANLTGIRGNDRPGTDALYSIGSDEYLSAAAVSQIVGSIICKADEAWSATGAGTRLEFYTTAKTTLVNTLRLTIDGDGLAILAGLTASTLIYSGAGKGITSLANSAGYLYNNGAGALSYVTTATATAHNVLSAIHGDSTTAAAVRGDVITAQGASPLWTRLAITVPAATYMNYLGTANGDTEPAYKALFDGTVPGTIAESAAAATGTATVAARRDHTHGAPATWAATAHNLLSTTHGDTTAASPVIGDLVMGNTGPVWTKLADVAVGQVLCSGGVGAIPAYSATPTLSALDLTVAGDPYLSLQPAAGTKWYVFADDSDSDQFKISTALNTNFLVMDPAGRIGLGIAPGSNAMYLYGASPIIRYEMTDNNGNAQFLIVNTGAEQFQYVMFGPSAAGTSWGYNRASLAYCQQSGANAFVISNAGNYDIAFTTNGTVRLTISGAGAVATVGSLTVGTTFGCNGASAQAAYTLNAAATDLDTVVALSNQIRAALIANGIGVAA